ncbi:ABC transporter permease [Oleisolibacter albus]|uniref:ABC transporter permease n=1 Tax=Oleisolibacter albus TaxID=2171757 RepID=UPI000DF2FCD8|nr:ABC transporter permease [Oleisolibacter albus]
MSRGDGRDGNGPDENGRKGRGLRILLPLLLAVLVLGSWEGLVRWRQIPVFVLPPPSLILRALVGDAGTLGASLWLTLTITLQAFALAVVSGVALAVLFSQSRSLAAALYPYAVILQVTPVVAIAPLVIIWVGYERVDLALLILAWIVAFFPILSNTSLGLSAVDPNLRDLFRLYGASRRQMLLRLQLPSALPYLLAGMKVSAGLALIGAVVAEFVAGSGTASGLAWRIVESGNRLNIPRMFAALALLAGLGVLLFAMLSWLQARLLNRWHESGLDR